MALGGGNSVVTTKLVDRIFSSNWLIVVFLRTVASLRADYQKRYLILGRCNRNIARRRHHSARTASNVPAGSWVQLAGVEIDDAVGTRLSRPEPAEDARGQ